MLEAQETFLKVIEKSKDEAEQKALGLEDERRKMKSKVPTTPFCSLAEKYKESFSKFLTSLSASDDFTLTMNSINIDSQVNEDDVQDKEIDQEFMTYLQNLQE